ncbi:MAG: hypothetical protein QM666_07895 [Acinetobacter sp.]
MKRYSFISMMVFAFSAQMSYAQLFEIKDGSKLYDVQIDVQCEKDSCDGKASITLFKKGNKQIFQQFHSDELTMYLNKQYQPSVNVVQLYGEQSPLIFEDFNFDGTEDLAILIGNYGAYGGPVYDVYVFNKTSKKFVFSSELSNLTEENLGMFYVDAKRKRIITFNKSGCCYHISSEYSVVPRKGLRLVREFIEDAQGGEVVLVKDRNLIKGKWVEKVKKYPISQYYKD